MTLKGFLISKSGNMTGGTTARDLDRAGQWDEKEFADLKQRRQELEKEKDTLSREHRNRSLKARSHATRHSTTRHTPLLSHALLSCYCC